MKKKLMATMGILGALFCANAIADGNTPVQPVPNTVEGARFFCEFSSEVKGTPVCKAYGRFLPVTGREDSASPVVDGNFMKIICDDEKIYDDGMKVVPHPDADDHGTTVDTDFEATLLGVIRTIHVQDLNFLDLNDTYRAELIFGIPGQPLTRVPGQCEFRFNAPPAH